MAQCNNHRALRSPPILELLHSPPDTGDYVRNCPVGKFRLQQHLHSVNRTAQGCLYVRSDRTLLVSICMDVENRTFVRTYRTVNVKQSDFLRTFHKMSAAAPERCTDQSGIFQKTENPSDENRIGVHALRDEFGCARHIAADVQHREDVNPH